MHSMQPAHAACFSSCNAIRVAERHNKPWWLGCFRPRKFVAAQQRALPFCSIAAVQWRSRPARRLLAAALSDNSQRRKGRFVRFSPEFAETARRAKALAYISASSAYSKLTFFFLSVSIFSLSWAFTLSCRAFDGVKTERGSTPPLSAQALQALGNK